MNQNEAETRNLHDGQPVTVKTKRGMDELVIVKHITIRQIPAYIEAQADEGALIKLVTGKDDKWVDSLVPESAIRLLEVADSVNRDFLSQSLKRRLQRLEVVNPVESRRLREMIESSSPAGSPESAS